MSLVFVLHSAQKTAHQPIYWPSWLKVTHFIENLRRIIAPNVGYKSRLALTVHWLDIPIDNLLFLPAAIVVVVPVTKLKNWTFLAIYNNESSKTYWATIAEAAMMTSWHRRSFDVIKPFRITTETPLELCSAAGLLRIFLPFSSHTHTCVWHDLILTSKWGANELWKPKAEFAQAFFALQYVNTLCTHICAHIYTCVAISMYV